MKRIQKLEKSSIEDKGKSSAFVESLIILLRKRIINYFRQDEVGRNQVIRTVYGRVVPTYWDTTASNRLSETIEHEVVNRVGKTYANTHTEDSQFGALTTEYYNQSLIHILKSLNADPKDFTIIKYGTGFTGVAHKVHEILGIHIAPETLNVIDRHFGVSIRESILKDTKNCPVVFITSYEHHSNELAFRHALCKVVVVNHIESTEDQFSLDIEDLKSKIKKYKDYKKLYGFFSVTSNMTGAKTNVNAVKKVFDNLRNEGDRQAILLWDVSAAIAHMPINIEVMGDGILFATHKKFGAPGTQGIAILRNTLDYAKQPIFPGGGTVKIVSPWEQHYLSSFQAREESGTQGALQTIRADLAFQLSDTIGAKKIEFYEQLLAKEFLRFLNNHKDKFHIIGNSNPDAKNRSCIVTFNIKHNNLILHPRLVVSWLNDRYGIQSRGGCFCVGPHGHDVFQVSREKSKIYKKEIVNEENELIKPGAIRIATDFFKTFQDIENLKQALLQTHAAADWIVGEYIADKTTGVWKHKTSVIASGNNTIDILKAVSHKKTSDKNKDDLAIRKFQRDQYLNNIYNIDTKESESDVEEVRQYYLLWYAGNSKAIMKIKEFSAKELRKLEENWYNIYISTSKYQEAFDIYLRNIPEKDRRQVKSIFNVYIDPRINRQKHKKLFPDACSILRKEYEKYLGDKVDFSLRDKTLGSERERIFGIHYTMLKAQYEVEALQRQSRPKLKPLHEILCNCKKLSLCYIAEKQLLSKKGIFNVPESVRLKDSLSTLLREKPVFIISILDKDRLTVQQEKTISTDTITKIQKNLNEIKKHLTIILYSDEYKMISVSNDTLLIITNHQQKQKKIAKLLEQALLNSNPICREKPEIELQQ